MKRSLLVGLIALFILGGASKVSAQKASGADGSDYSTAVGLGFDLGDGTLIGPSVKHFFSENNVGQAELLFGNHTTSIQLFYQYHQEIAGAAGLRWFVGAGPAIRFYGYRGFHQTDIALIPMAGLDYKIPAAPIAISFDWRPQFYITHGGGSEAGRFGLGFRYAFNTK